MWDRKAERIAKYNKKQQQEIYKKNKPSNYKRIQKQVNDTKQNK